MGHSKTGKRALTTYANIERVLECRMSGMSYRAIAKELGIARSTVQRYMNQYLIEIKARILETADQVVTLELTRLDELHNAYWASALRGDLNAAVMVLKVMERRSKYLGLDAPDAVRSTIVVDPVDLGKLDDAEIETMKQLTEKAST